MLCKPLAHCGGYTKEDHMCEYNTPFKLIERCEPDLDEKTLSRFVYSGRVRLEKAPGRPLTVEELRAWVTRRGLPPGYLPFMGIHVEDVERESCGGRDQFSSAQIKNPPGQTGRADSFFIMPVRYRTAERRRSATSASTAWLAARWG